MLGMVAYTWQVPELGLECWEYLKIRGDTVHHWGYHQACLGYGGMAVVGPGWQQHPCPRSCTIASSCLNQELQVGLWAVKMGPGL